MADSLGSLPDAQLAGSPVAPPPTLTTPAGLDANAELRRRRLIVLALNVGTWALLLWGVATVLGTGGWTAVDVVLLVCFMLASPWTVLGFWNAVIGLWLLHYRRDGLAITAPYLAAAQDRTPIGIGTAVLMTVRNEDPARALLRLKTIKASIDATGEGARFSYFVLSDTTIPEIAEAEEQAIAAWRARETDAGRIAYRRRAKNIAFKAGNVRDFCAHWGPSFELMLPLDADSLMDGDTIVGLVRIMQAHPKIGILQSLVVGLPTTSAFARIFQFGMRHGMRSYTMGQAWWVADCGPFWGHNAVVRLEPFHRHCALPILPGEPPLGGHILSHDQVEAAFMRRAGYEVRILPGEAGSWEDNPPTLIEFMHRDVRWCQGNVQYLKLLDTAGLPPLSRFQLVWAIAMFLGLPATTLVLALLPVAAWQAQGTAGFPATLAATLYVAFLLMQVSPKLAGLADVVLTPSGVIRYGGPARFAAGALIEFVFAFLQGAVSSFRTTIFMFGLLFGRSIAWSGQARDAHGVSWKTALRALWPQLAFGLAVCGLLISISPAVFWWSLPLTAGYILGVPFCVLTASEVFGRVLKRTGLCGVPEDFNPPPEVRAIAA